ncbi:MAG: FliH/SctL family protein [Aquabacterium sp.]
MSMAILKSPTLNHQRLSLGGARDQADVPASVPVVDERQAIEARLRTELEAQFKAQYEAEYLAKLEAAQDEARAEGYKEGLASGHQDGMDSAIESFKKKQAALEQILSKAEAQLEDWLQNVADEALALAKEAVCQFIGEQALNPAMLQNIIKRVSAGLRDADVLGIRMHPAECQMLRSALKQAAGAQGASSRMADKLTDDSSMEMGGVVIDTPRGEYRATLDVQLKKMVAMLDALRAAQLSSTPVYHALRA